MLGRHTDHHGDETLQLLPVLGVVHQVLVPVNTGGAASPDIIQVQYMIFFSVPSHQPEQPRVQSSPLLATPAG